MSGDANARPSIACLEGTLTLGRSVLLVAWREIGRTAARRWRAFEADTEVRPPCARLTLAAPGGEALHLLMLAPPRSGQLRLEANDGSPVLAVEPSRAPPLALADLARGLSPHDRRRLLGWLLGVCPSVFRLGAEPELGFVAHEILQALVSTVRIGTALRRCHVPGGWTLIEFTVGGLEPDRLEAFVLSRRGGLRRAIVPPAVAEPAFPGRHEVVAAFEDLDGGASATLILLGAGGPVCRRIEAARRPMPPVAGWIAAAAGNGRHRTRVAALNALALLADRPGCKPSHGDLVREAIRLAPALPPRLPGELEGALVAVTVVGRQILAIGRIADPDRMVAAVRLRRLGAPDIDIHWADLVLSPHPNPSGAKTFVATAAASMPGNARLPWQGYFVLGSGAEYEIGEEPPPAMAALPVEHLLECAAPMSELPTAWTVLEPMLRAAASHCGVGLQRREIKLLGPALLRPRATLVVPFRRAVDAVRLIAMLDAEAEGRSVEIALVALGPDPTIVHEAAILAERHARAVRLVLPSQLLTPADAPALGVDATEAPIILSAGLEVVPRVRGWLSVLLTALDSSPMPGAGLALAGLPLAGEPDPLPSLGALAGMRRDALLAAGGIARDWLDSKHRDADLALRLLAVGFRVGMLAGPSCICTGPGGTQRSAEASRLAAALDTRRLADRAAAWRGRQFDAPFPQSRAPSLAAAG